MWPSESSPAVDGGTPARRIHATAARGPYPAAGPPTTRREWAPPRVSIHITQSDTGWPPASTGTVLAHCPVTLTAATWAARTAPLAMARRVASTMICHHSSASCTAPPWSSQRVLTAM